jgi:FkbM family methyltransferase
VILTAWRAVRSGEKLADKLRIATRLMIYLAFPVGVLARRLGHPIPDPTRLLGEITVRGPTGRFAIPSGPGAEFLGVDRTFEPRLCALLENTDGTVVDVGASIGLVTVRAARTAARVIAIEPHPVRFRYLKRNVALNGLDNVSCINCAVGSREGEVVIYDIDPTLGPHPLHVSTRPGRGRRYRVSLHRLDALVEEADLVKVDVEGYEREVLRGAARLISRGTGFVIEAFDGPAELKPLLPGYTLRELDPNNYLAFVASNSP